MDAKQEAASRHVMPAHNPPLGQPTEDNAAQPPIVPEVDDEKHSEDGDESPSMYLWFWNMVDSVTTWVSGQ